MEFKTENGDGIDSWREVTLVYNAALRQMETKMAILNPLRSISHLTPTTTNSLKTASWLKGR